MTETIEIKLGRIRLKFAAALVDRQQEFLDAIKNLKVADRYEEALQQLRIGSHNIRGSAATLGFGSLGTAAAHLDDSITSRIKSGPDFAKLDQIEPEIGALMSEIDAILADKDTRIRGDRAAMFDRFSPPDAG